MERTRIWLLGCGALLLAGAAHAQQVYKWVDERGVVNYSTTAPKDRAATKLDPESSRLTVIPAMAPPNRAAAPGPDAAVDARLTRLEEEARRERNAQTALANADAERVRLLRERCERERWVDCGDDRALYARYGGTFGGPVAGYGYAYGPGVIVAPPLRRTIPPTRIIEAPPEPPRPPVLVGPRNGSGQGGTRIGGPHGGGAVGR